MKQTTKISIVSGALVLLLGSAGLLLTRGFEFMPAMSTPQISAEITMPKDSTIEETAAINDEIMDAVRKIDGVETAGAMLASTTASSFGMGGTDTDNRDELRMDLSKLSEKELEALAQLIMKKLRDAIRQESDRSGNV